MLSYYRSLLLALTHPVLQNRTCHQWAEQLPQQIQHGLSQQRYGDLSRWQQALNRLPHTTPGMIDLTQSVTIGTGDDCTLAEQQCIKEQLQALIPWRKGPISIHDIVVDTEWRSDWKWQRLIPHLAPLKDRQILDVGCGNGYHCLRSYGAGAKRVIGIDPSPRFVVQFYMMKHFLGDIPVDVLPVGIESLPTDLSTFDTTFSMGVIYHRRSPMDHLRELAATLKPGGQLVLETLIIHGVCGDVLVPEGRYAMMNNIWFLPSAETLISWMRKCGFKNPRVVDISQTTTAEQRTTAWMPSYSLSNFLDPDNHNNTVEGHPAPLRGVFLAEI